MESNAAHCCEPLMAALKTKVIDPEFMCNV